MRRMYTENQIKKIADAYSEEVIDITFASGETEKTILFEENKLYYITTNNSVCNIKSPNFLGLISGSFASYIDEVLGIFAEPSERRFSIVENRELMIKFSQGIVYCIIIEA